MIAIAIDGPAGAGKSTISRELARALGYVHVDTGALYRAVGLYVLENGVEPTSQEQVGALLKEIEVSLAHIGGEQRVFLSGRDVSTDIRRPEVSMAASHVSAQPAVRSFLFDLQQQMAKIHNVVMDGRDIGTVVLPHAQVKLFLTATPEDRARRRYEELIQKGHTVDYDTLLAEVRARDHNDTTRTHAPLKQAQDAVRVDTTGNTLEQSVSLLVNLVKEKLADVL